jgi:hypothetical protein
VLADNARMLSPGSILTRLPYMADRHQTLFLDGLRHSAEMAEIAYLRLIAGLTTLANLADDAESMAATKTLIPAAYLDAWAFVDSLYRMRGLFKHYPHKRPGPPKAGLAEALDAIAKVRNVSDHLGQRMKAVEASDAPALGVLIWCTVQSLTRAQICTIYPGTVAEVRVGTPLPTGKVFKGPTDHVTLRAGPHEVNLSDAYRVARRAIRALESEVGAQIEAVGASDASGGADLMVRMTIQFDQPLETVAVDSTEKDGNSTGPAASGP